MISMKYLHAVVIALVCCLALLASACGGGDDGEDRQPLDDGNGTDDDDSSADDDTDGGTSCTSTEICEDDHLCYHLGDLTNCDEDACFIDGTVGQTQTGVCVSHCLSHDECPDGYFCPNACEGLFQGLKPKWCTPMAHWDKFVCDK